MSQSTQSCETCGGPLGFLFNGTYCKNGHCDLPADKRAIAQKKDLEVKLKNVSTNRNTSNPGNYSPGVPATLPASGITASTAWGGRTNCPICGLSAARYAVKVNSVYYCTSPNSATKQLCTGSWPAIVSAAATNTSAHQPGVNYPSGTGWNLATPPDSITVNWGGRLVKVVADPDGGKPTAYWLNGVPQVTYWIR